jgi:maltose-binding protein MalE
MRGRRSPTLSLILFISLMTLGGCQPDRPHSSSLRLTSNAPTLTLWHAYRGEERLFLERALSDFRLRTGSNVRALHLPYNAFANKLQIAIPRGNGPDLFIFAHDRVGDWAESALIEPIGYWMDAASQAIFYPSAMQALTYRGQLYGLPLSCKTLALFYHRGLIDAPPKTTDELIQSAKSVQESVTDAWGLAYPELDSLYFHAPWIHAFTDRPLSPDLKTRVNSPEVSRSVAYVHRLRDELKLIPPEVNGALISELFRRKKLAFVINGPWFKGDLEGGEADEEASHSRGEKRPWWGVAPLPTLSETGRPLAPFLSVEAVMISPRSAHPERAWTLARFLASEALAEKRLLDGQLVAHMRPYSGKEANESQWIQTFRAQFDMAVPLSNAPAMKRMWTPMKRALSRAILYGHLPKPALDEAQHTLQGFIDRERRAQRGGRDDL